MSGHLESFSLPNLSLFIVKVLAGEYQDNSEQGIDRCICIGIGMGVGRLALPRAGHIKHPDAMVLYERGKQERRALSGDLLCINKLVRLVFFDAKQERLLGSALDLAEIEDRRSVALENITQGSLAVSTFLDLDKGVTLWNLAVFSQASRRAPAAAGETPSKGGIQSAPVSACLPSGDDLRQLHLTFPHTLRSIYIEL